MPEKEKTEKEKAKRRQGSLQAKVFGVSLFNCILIGVVALLIGLGFYVVALGRQMIDQTFNIASSASVSVTKGGADSTGFADEVMRRYRALSAEERAKVGTDEYRAHFDDLLETRDYDLLVHMVEAQLERNEVFDVYYAMYDAETQAIVYFADADPDPETVCMPGDWEPVEQKEIDRFLNWNGEGSLYDLGKTDKYGWLCTAGVPITTKDGQVKGFVLADVTSAEIVAKARFFALQYSIAIILLTVVIAFVSTRRSKKAIVDPINEIAAAAQSYVSDKKEGAAQTGHFARLSIRTGDEIENLSHIMAEMERDIDTYTDDLTRVTAEKARIGTELDMAAQIQAAMLPHIFPAYPDRKEFDLYASMEPAKEVGGDFYDFFLIDDDHLCLVMADVSGKGVPASLFMMVTKVIIQSIAMMGQTAAEILNKTNEALCKDNQMEMFVTCWIGILQISTGRLTTSNAGHEYPVIKAPGGKFELYKDRHSFALGGFDDEVYEHETIYLQPGSKLFVYTDGVPEAMDSGRKQFGLDRMISALNEDPDAPPEELLGHVRSAVSTFVKNAEPFDDLTMLCLEYKG